MKQKVYVKDLPIKKKNLNISLILDLLNLIIDENGYYTSKDDNKEKNNSDNPIGKKESAIVKENQHNDMKINNKSDNSYYKDPESFNYETIIYDEWG